MAPRKKKPAKFVWDKERSRFLLHCFNVVTAKKLANNCKLHCGGYFPLDAAPKYRARLATIQQDIRITLQTNPPALPEEGPLHLRAIAEQDVASAIASLRNHSAPGEDGISNTLLKQLPNSAITYLTTILNSCLQQGHYPSSWKTAIVIMISKPRKNLTNPASYRPISLLNTTNKVYERILHQKISSFCQEQNIIPSNQFGFMPNRCVQDAVLPRTPLEAAQVLQKQIVVLDAWMLQWRIQPNPSKTQLILFRHKNKRIYSQISITLRNTTITPNEYTWDTH
ncbi:hypothetical protein CBL_08531 [Carabus blaptoides fortunei]